MHPSQYFMLNLSPICEIAMKICQIDQKLKKRGTMAKSP